jgi:hypothetical protein
MLTTLADVKLYLGAKAADYTDAQITAMVNAASVAINKYCDRVLEATDYAEWLDGSGEYKLRLTQYPIITLRRVLLNSFESMTLQNSAVGAFGASVSVNSGNLNLTVVGGASAGTDTLTLVTYTTLALLEAAILALGHGWSVTVASEARPKDLRTIGLSGAFSTAVGLESPDETQTIDVNIDTPSGLLYASAGWPLGTQNVFVDYRAGYETIPEDLAFIAIRLASDLLNSTQINPDLESERLGDYSYKIRAAARGLLAQKYSVELADYKRLAL